MGPHSHRHLLYCDWYKPDSLFVTHPQFDEDIQANLKVLRSFTKEEEQPVYFIPPYEWYNDSISAWSEAAGLKLFNFTPGLLTNTDYTTPDMKNYRSSETIWEQLIQYEQAHASGLNGFLMLIHIGTDPGRTDKFYHRLPALVDLLTQKGYRFVRVDELLK